MEDINPPKGNLKDNCKSNTDDYISASILYRFPEIAKEWHPDKNEKKPDEFLPGSNKKVWWKCERGHEWEAVISNRTKGAKCPYCSNSKVCLENSISTKFPEVAKEWHPNKNDKKPDEFLPGSNQKVWWKCQKNSDHEWQSTINSRCLKNSGCPYCNSKTTFGGNTIADKFPEIAKEWHPTKNKPLMPSGVCPSSEKKIWWICPQNHEYEAKCSNRTKSKTGCPFCSGNKTSKENNFGSIFPELVKEWHSSKNTKTPSEYTVSSGVKVWWKCQKNPNHEWAATIINRTQKKTGCPICLDSKVSKTNNLEVTHPEIIKDWHPTKNDLLKPNDITIGYNINKIWWLCNNKHEWNSKITDKINFGCPSCNISNMGQKVLKYLEENSIPFEIKKKFKGLGLLSFDFYLPNENILIDCDNHNVFEADKNLNKRLEMIKKNVFALQKNIPLLRISYLEENYVETIIKSFIIRSKKDKIPICFSNPRLYKYLTYQNSKP